MKDWEYKTAADHGMNNTDRWRSIRREPGLMSFFAQKILHETVSGYLHLFHRIKIEGRENLPKQPPFILVANHSSHLDVLALMTALPSSLREHSFPIAAGDVFFQTPSLSAFSAIFLNALPMWRKHCGAHAVQDLRDRLLHDPVIYLLFPEGTRSRDGTMGSFKSGVGMLVAETQVPVVPCGLKGCFDAFPPHGGFPRPVEIRIQIDKPRIFEDRKNDRTAWHEIADVLRQDVREAVSKAGGKAEK